VAVTFETDVYLSNRIGREFADALTDRAVQCMSVSGHPHMFAIEHTPQVSTPNVELELSSAARTVPEAAAEQTESVEVTSREEPL
jgi:hypothetical protein